MYSHITYTLCEYTYSYLYEYVHTYRWCTMYTHIEYTSICMYVLIQVWVRTHTSMSTYIHIDVHTYIHKYEHVYKYNHVLNALPLRLQAHNCTHKNDYGWSICGIYTRFLQVLRLLLLMCSLRMVHKGYIYMVQIYKCPQRAASSPPSTQLHTLTYTCIHKND